MGKKKQRKLKKRGAEMGYAAEMAHAPAYGSEAIDDSLLHRLPGLLGSRRSEQFVLGALIGAAAVYVLGDEKLRGKLLKAGVGLYSSIAGGFEEMKEQMADIKAEIQAEGSSAP